MIRMEQDDKVCRIKKIGICGGEPNERKNLSYSMRNDYHWVSVSNPDTITLVLLPGLTADHRLFDKQIQYFENRYNVIVWDAPAHASSWPFRFDFDLFDKAKWLDDILNQEGLTKPVIVGQSMGGYVGQAYAQLYPDKMTGFVSIDSAPLQRSYVTAAEIWLLKRMEPVYAHYPWKWLLKSGSEGVATTDYGRSLMREMMLTYDGNQKRYATNCWTWLSYFGSGHGKESAV